MQSETVSLWLPKYSGPLSKWKESYHLVFQTETKYLFKNFVYKEEYKRDLNQSLLVLLYVLHVGGLKVELNADTPLPHLFSDEGYDNGEMERKASLFSPSSV